ncbi:MAG: Glu-tRNA(Gln) amidotransferase subunit GatE [Candidatus Altiarchaeota archaeon]
MDIDYKKLGFKCGIEIHQQLNTHKLFCSCPSLIRDDPPDIRVVRRMRAVAGELGNVDPAALHEFLRDRTLLYEAYSDSTCLVELDEEPPHPLNKEALMVVLEVSALLHARVVDEVHVMRKTVIDGSNTSGFQRTMLVAQGGWIETSKGKVGIDTICLEEDAARIIGEENGKIIYRLDRLGIPLAEIATDASIKDPQHAREVAEKLGQILRQTGKVKRGLGTIRQDINVSISGGARIEAKGVQDLKQISKIVENEVRRQAKLIKIKAELENRKAKSSDLKDLYLELTEELRKDKRAWLKKKFDGGERAFAVKLPGFAEILGTELMTDHRFGTELSQVAKAKAGIGGILHSDEQFDQDVKKAIEQNLTVGANDGWVIVVASSDIAKKALAAIVFRAKQAFIGVPEETRMAEGDKTAYMRPLPGSARMYPETDERYEKISTKLLDEIDGNLPESFEEKKKRFEALGLSTEMANQIVHSQKTEIIEKQIRQFPEVSPVVIASVNTSLLKEAEKRFGAEPNLFDEKHAAQLVVCISNHSTSLSSIPEIIAESSKNPKQSIKNIIKEKGLGIVSGKKLGELVNEVLEENNDLVKKIGEKAIGPLTGKIMAKIQGRADANEVKELLRKKL